MTMMNMTDPINQSIDWPSDNCITNQPVKQSNKRQHLQHPPRTIFPVEPEKELDSEFERPKTEIKESVQSIAVWFLNKIGKLTIIRRIRSKASKNTSSDNKHSPLENAQKLNDKNVTNLQRFIPTSRHYALIISAVNVVHRLDHVVVGANLRHLIRRQIPHFQGLIRWAEKNLASVLQNKTGQNLLAVGNI